MSEKSYGLLGKTLAHSYSPRLHHFFGNDDYALFEQTEEALPVFLRQKNLKGLNVTIPYKTAIMDYCDVIDDRAQRIGSVNTLVFEEDGKISAYNTDYDGFSALLARKGLVPKGVKALLLGDGATAKTVRAVLQDEGAREIIQLSRAGTNRYESAKDHCDAQWVVNCTPVGMYPNTMASLVDLDIFPCAQAIVDVVYNPHRTKLLMDAEERGIPYTGGLPMLVYQAKRAAELFTGEQIASEKTEEVLKVIRKEMDNIVLIGMPGSGKTTIGKRVACDLGRTFVDLDAEIEKTAQMKIPELFERFGEEGFRAIESSVIRAFGKESRLVISTGGGVVLDRENYAHLHQNATIFQIERELMELPISGRPLSKGGITVLQEMYKRRKPLYDDFCDVVVVNDRLERAVLEIEEGYL